MSKKEQESNSKKVFPKNLPWFRMYVESVDDDKLRLLAFEDRWHFVALLCCKAKGILDDAGPLLLRRVSVRLGLSSRELEEVARRLADVGLVEQDTLQPIAWDKRQFVSDCDPTKAERQKRYRESKKDRNALRNATVTRIDTDTDTDKLSHKKGAAKQSKMAGVDLVMVDGKWHEVATGAEVSNG